MENPLIDKEYLLQKFPGKGGWTYAAILEIQPDKRAYFGLIKVNGFIDGYQLKDACLMPLRSGGLFLSVKAEIRKHIKKQAGDTVHLTLFPQHPASNIQEDLILCLQDEPAAYNNYLNCSENEKQRFIDWVATAKSEEEKVERIAGLINRLDNWQPQNAR